MYGAVSEEEQPLETKTTTRRWAKLGYHTLGLCLVGCLFASSAWSIEVDVLCVKFYQSMQFRKAALCFRSLSDAMGDLRRLKRRQRLQKGRYLRNAAMSFQRAATQQTKPPLQLVLKEQALRLYKHILRGRLCETASRCKRLQKRMTDLKKSIGYASLSIQVVGRVKRISVYGFHFSHQISGSWKGSLRPGRYKVVVVYPQSLAQEKALTLKPGESQQFVVRPLRRQAPRQTRVPTYSWVGYIGGGVALAAGGTLLAVGLGNRQATQTCWVSPSCNDIVSESERVVALDSAEQMAWIGAGAAALGVAMLLSGGIVQAIQPQTSTPPPLPSSSKQTLFFQSEP